MSSGRRAVIIAVSGLVVWYAVTLFAWAARPQHDSVPVGTDYTLKTPALVSKTVSCSTLFSSASRADAGLPALTPQPSNVPALKYQRTPCTSVHSQARLLFALDTLFIITALGAGAYLLLRHRRTLDPPVSALPTPA